MAAHFFFLWVLFSADWPHHVTGPTSFVREFVLASGAWVPLTLTFLAGFAGLCHSPARPKFVDAMEAKLYPNRVPLPPKASLKPADGVGPVVGGTLGRIAIMQVSVIIGAMLSRSYGTQAPLLIMIGLKTLFGFQSRDASSHGIPVHMEFKSGGKTTTLDINKEN
jgi:hypothetical protein